ncbi:MAG: lipopolysaccharide assembly protein LapA domain-containing protein [bacterium]
MRMILFLIGGFLIGGAAVAFALQNVTTVTVTLFSWHFESSLALIIILAIAIGALISSLWSLPRNIKKSLQISNLKKQNSKLEKELSDKNNKVESEKPEVVTNNAGLNNL